MNPNWSPTAYDNANMSQPWEMAGPPSPAMQQPTRPAMTSHIPPGPLNGGGMSMQHLIPLLMMSSAIPGRGGKPSAANNMLPWLMLMSHYQGQQPQPQMQQPPMNYAQTGQ